MALTIYKIDNAKPKQKPYKLYDEFGLFLIVTPKGGKWWRHRYTYNNKEQTLSLGTYPDVSLKEAREKRDELRSQIKANVNPSTVRKADKLMKHTSELNDFECVALDWIDRIKHTISADYHKKLIRSLELHIFPHLGKMPIDEIEPLHFLEVIKKIESRGTIETAHRVFSLCSQVFKYGVTLGKNKRDITSDLNKRYALKPTNEKHHPSIKDKSLLRELLRAIDDYRGYPSIKYALALVPHIFLRSGELTALEWSEVDFENAMITVPAEKMKMKSPHFVPLSTQAIEILRELQKYTGKTKWLFASPRGTARHITRESLNIALKSLGFEVVTHGFRTTASTLLHENMSEHGFHSEAIERQLAHAERNGIKATYNHAEYLPQRKQLMQWWSDKLYSIKAGG